MNILVKVNKYIDFLPTEEKPDGSLNYRQDAAGKTLKKTIVEQDTETFISIPDWQIESLVKQTEKTRNEVFASFIEDQVMPSQAPRNGWVRFEVEKDPELEKYLNNRFELRGAKK